MECEVVAVGTELLLGQIVDTNSAWIGEQLALAGIDSHLQTKVGDNLARIVAVLHTALDRSDAVIVCGGLGPTQDDITRDAIAAVMGVPLKRDPELVDAIAAMFAGRDRAMPDNNLLQADVPEGASIIPQTRGTAPGLICPIGDGGSASPKVIYAVPGVPYEMRDMLERAVLPDLRRRAGVQSAIVSRTLRTWGDSESGLAERLAGRIDALDAGGGVTIAFLASGIEGLKVRLTAKAPTEAEASERIAVEEATIRQLLGPTVFGVDGETMEYAVFDLLRRQGRTLALAESLTGGMIGARFSDVPGVSEVFVGGVVSYASRVKRDLLDVPDGPVVSAPAAEAMATGVRSLLDADIGLAVTGVAGPEPQDGQPPGVVFVGWAIGNEVASRRLRLPGDRERVRQFTVISALDLLRHRLLEQEQQ
ncbi:MAG: competence/damage-inducible protein A [Acidimicrobiales bacterium]